MSKLYEFPTVIHRVFNYNGHIYETIINKDNFSEQINIRDGEYIKVSDLVFNSGVVVNKILNLKQFVDSFASHIMKTEKDDVFVYDGINKICVHNPKYEQISIYDFGEYQSGRYINLKYLNKFLGYLVFRINRDEFTINNIYWSSYLVKEYEKTRIKIIKRYNDTNFKYFSIVNKDGENEEKPGENEEKPGELTGLLSNVINSQNLINQYLEHGDIKDISNEEINMITNDIYEMNYELKKLNERLNKDSHNK